MITINKLVVNIGHTDHDLPLVYLKVTNFSPFIFPEYTPLVPWIKAYIVSYKDTGTDNLS